MSVSYATVDSTKMELTPMRVSWKGPGASVYSQLGGTLGNVVVEIKYEKADIKADQLGTTTLDRRVKGLVMSVTTELTQVADKLNIWKTVFPHGTTGSHTETGASISVATPGVVTKAAHGFSIGEAIQFTAGTVPTGLSLNTTYYIVAAGFTSGAFSVALTAGGVAIDTTGSPGTGVTISSVTDQVFIDFNSAVGDGDLANAGELLLHPLSQPDTELDFDWTFFKACASAESSITYGPDKQATLKIVWNILPDTSLTPAQFARHGDASL